MQTQEIHREDIKKRRWRGSNRVEHLGAFREIIRDVLAESYVVVRLEEGDPRTLPAPSVVYGPGADDASVDSVRLVLVAAPGEEDDLVVERCHGLDALGQPAWLPEVGPVAETLKGMYRRFTQ